VSELLNGSLSTSLASSPESVQIAVAARTSATSGFIDYLPSETDLWPRPLTI
jgi:hypothetical protein